MRTPASASDSSSSSIGRGFDYENEDDDVGHNNFMPCLGVLCALAVNNL